MKNNNHHDNVTVATFLNRHQIDYLDKLGKDCFFKFGHKVSRAKILSELVDFLMHLRVNVGKMDLEHKTLCECIEGLVEHEEKTEL